MSELSGTRPPASRRSRLFLALALTGLGAWLALGLRVTDLVPTGNGTAILESFARGAISPAFDYEAHDVPEGTLPFLQKVLGAARTTLVFAAGGMSLAILFGFILGFLGSTAWWPPGTQRRKLGTLFALVRLLIAGMRSIHELVWALFFLAALGLNSFAAVLAIAIPYGGTLAKVFSEMIDEAPRDAADNLRAIGAGPLQVFFLGLLPRALPDACTYTFYRFECAVRSSAVLGFFGYPTFGYYIRLSVENLHYREVWTYLYALFALVLALELWSSQLRRRVVMR